MKYVAYVRVSTEKQGRSGLGLEAQMEIIKYNVGTDKIIKWFTEIRSGKDTEKLKELNKAILLAKDKNAVLVMAKTDRLRNTQQALDLVDKLTPEGVFFCNVGRNADKFMLTLYFAFAEKERLEISIRTKAALARLKAKGVKLGVYTHRAYKNKKKAKKFMHYNANLAALGAAAMRKKSLMHPNNISSAAEAIKLRLHGDTYNEIVTKLNKAGYKTMRGGLWSTGSVYKLLKRHFN